ncbi:MAG: type I methionyl aminopeptidase [Candidatus Pacebacteria bacterium]|nr:type I methionyl aminopeptidase [Candidatus Paceibacterota bacterium]
MPKQKINIKSKSEIEIMRESGKILAEILQLLASKVEPGISGDELEKITEKEIEKYNVIPSFKNYRISKNIAPFPSALCFSINDEIVHGFPFGKVIKEGDIVSIDMGVKYKGFHSDSACTVGAGKINKKAKKLIKVTKESLFKGIEQVKPGNRTGDIGYAVQKHAEKNGFSVVRNLVGHGVGRSIHEPPEIPNFGSRRTGLKLYPGMTFAIEPMLNEGNYYIKCDNDGWTIRTKDGKLSAHFEHTVAVTNNGCEILTR